MSVSVPDGTTFVMSDIEGSTRRWEADPDHMASLLEAHDAAIERTVASFAGELIKSRGEGDSTFAVFPSPLDAVRSALQCQLFLIGELGLPVRMAIHTGRASRRWGEYYGPPVNRTARLRSVAGGGRVLLSSTTAEDVRDRLPVPCSLVDLGVHLLKDLGEPEHIYGLSHPQLPGVLAPQPEVGGPGMVGRLTELAALRQVLGDAQAARTRLAVVVGEAGIGKTRLAQEIGREACAGGGRLVWATARSDTGAPPFSLWQDVVRRLAPGEPTGAGGASFDYERVAEGLRSAAGGEVLVVVLDDLHLADPSSLELLRRLGAGEELGGVLLLALSRPVPESSPGRQVVTDLARRAGATRINLSCLNDHEAARVVTSHVPGMDREVVDEVVRRAGGNPLFLRECATSVARRAAAAPGAEAALPDTVRAAVYDRLGHLQPGSVPVVEVAAVAGRSITVDVVAAACGADVDAVLRALGDAEKAGLVARAATSVSSWSFAHDLLREALVARLDAAERANVHGRIGRAIERLRAADLAAHAAEIATHLSEATAADWPDAVAFGDLAAVTALKAGAFEEAAAHCARALARSETCPARAETRGHLLILQGRALIADDLQAAGAALLEAITVARRTGDQKLLLAAVASLPHDMGALDARAVAELKAALHQLGDAEPPLAARLHGLLSFHYFTIQQWGEQASTGRRAWELSRQAADPETRFYGSLARLLLIWGGAGAEDRRQVLDEFMWSADACSDPSAGLKGRYFRARALLEAADRNRFSATLSSLQRGVAGHVAHFSEWVIMVWGALLATMGGDLDAADGLLEQAGDFGRASAGPVAAMARLHQKLVVRFEQGRGGEMIGALRNMQGPLADTPVIGAWLALALAEGGEEAAARQMLKEMHDDGFDAVPAQQCFALAPMAEAVIALGESAMVPALAGAIRPHAGHVLVGFGVASACYGAADRYLGLLSTLAGDPDAALEHHRAAGRLHRRLGSALWTLHGRVDAAEALVARGRPGDAGGARAILETVAAEAGGTSMARVQRRAARALAGVGD